MLSFICRTKQRLGCFLLHGFGLQKKWAIDFIGKIAIGDSCVIKQGSLEWCMLQATL